MSLAQGNSSNAEPAKQGRVLILVRGLLVLGVAALIAVSLGAALATWLPPLVMLTPFAPQVAAVALIAAMLGLALGMRRWVLVPAALALWQGALLLPFLWPVAPVPVAGAPLHVLSLNLWINNPVPERTIDYLLHSGADVIATVETSPHWRQRLTVALAPVYPYQLACPVHVRCAGVALFSKLPFQSEAIGPLEGGFPVVGQVTIDWEGKPLTIAALQVLNPRIGLLRGFQAQQGDVLTRAFDGLPVDAVMMGDFNSVPWGPLQREFRAGTGFDNRGRLAFTWPSWAPAIFRIPIDQIFTRGAVAVRNYHAGPAAGSDHLPVSAEIYRTSP